MYKSFFKRLFDICGSLLAIPFVVIIGLFVGLAIYWEDKGDVFYLASRRGRYGKIFKMLQIFVIRIIQLIILRMIQELLKWVSLYVELLLMNYLNFSMC